MNALKYGEPIVGTGMYKCIVCGEVIREPIEYENDGIPSRCVSCDEPAHGKCLEDERCKDVLCRELCDTEKPSHE